MAAAAAAAVAALAGCGTSSSPGPAPASGSIAAGIGQPVSSAASASTSASAPATTASQWWPAAAGDTWTYSATAVGQSITTVNKVTGLTPVTGGQQVAMATATTAGGATTNGTSDYVFHSDGSITYPIGQLSGNGTGASVKVVSGDLVWPSITDLEAGQVAHSNLELAVSASGQTQDVSAQVTVRGGGTQQVSVPAGSYSADVVDMSMAENLHGTPVTTQVQFWLAEGTGPVQEVTTVTQNGQQTGATLKSVLTSFKQG